jgi:hypothetical protein
MENNELKNLLELIFNEVRWIRNNQNPPVNYSLVILVSIIVSVITMIIALRLMQV